MSRLTLESKGHSDNKNCESQSRNINPFDVEENFVDCDEATKNIAMPHMHKIRPKTLLSTSADSSHQEQDTNVRATRHMQDSMEDQLSRTKNRHCHNYTYIEPTAHIRATEEDKLRRLWDLYRQVRDEYLATTEKVPNDHTNAAIFLRDTIENCIKYLDEISPRSTTLTFKELNAMKRELSATLKTATEAAEKGLGGKKRHFDSIDEDYQEQRYSRRGFPRWNYSGRSIGTGSRGVRSSPKIGDPKKEFHDKSRHRSMDDRRLLHYSRVGADIYRPSQPDNYRPPYSPLFVLAESSRNDLSEE